MAKKTTPKAKAAIPKAVRSAPLSAAATPAPEPTATGGYYDALIAKWATAPAGTTDQKLTWINAEVVTGQIPTKFYTTSDQLLNCINYPEFKVLTPEKQNNLLALCRSPGQLMGGSATTAFIVAGMFVDYFPVAGPTIAALTALAKGTVIPWWQATVAQGGGGLSSPVSHADCDACVPPLT